MIHLFYVTYDYSGAGTYSLQLLSYLRKCKGIAVEEVCLNCKDVSVFTIEDLSSVSASGEGRRFLFPEKNEDDLPAEIVVNLLSPWIHSENLVFHFNTPLHDSIAEEVKKRFSARVVVTLHFLDIRHTWTKINTTSVTTTVKTVLSEKMKAICDKIICVTDFAKTCLETVDGIAPEKLVRVYNGYNSALPVARERDIRRSFGFGNEDYILLYVGRINRYKGVGYLANAFLRAADVDRDIKLVLAGTGDFGSFLNFIDRHYGRIVMMGNLPKERLAELYRIADMGVIPSLVEQGGYVTLEMMRNGIPLIASDIPGLNEIAGRDGSACLVRSYVAFNDSGKGIIALDETQLSGFILDMKQCPAKASKVAERGYERWRKFFRSETMAKQTVRVYRETVGSKRVV